jgi:multiple sugar transport system substrate-binding protein
MKRPWKAIPVVFALLAAACTGGGGGGSSGGPVHLVMWMGYTPPPPVNTSQENVSLMAIVKAFERTHHNVTIDVRYVNNDYALQRVTVALTGDKQPDISYQYGTSMPQLASTPKLVDLTSRVKAAGYNFNDFFPGERAVSVLNGKVLGVPALVDNLAVVYNKDLFAKAGLKPPGPDWTWDELAADAKAITDPANKVFGLAFPADGTEATVAWFETLLWEAGGDILNADNTKAVFNSAAGVQALSLLRQMEQDGSLYLDFNPDAGKTEDLFNSKRVGMLITAPWDLPSFPDAHYGIQFMPSFQPGGNHDTIAGPDNWVIFDNGQDHVNAAWEFLSFLTSPQQVLRNSMRTGDLPTRASVVEQPGFVNAFNTRYPGEGTFAENLKNVIKARPQIPQYPRVSQALGQAIVAGIKGQGSPQDLLNAAAQQANGFLAVPA